MSSAVDMATVVLVHGAWADGSCWNNVILPLRHQELNVTAAPILLTSLTDDSAVLRRVIERTSGPVILVGHAYGGAVIGAVHDDRVKSLVYIAALAPDEGETVADVFYRTDPHPNAPQLSLDEYGLIWMPEDGFGQAMAHNASWIKQPSWQQCNGRSRLTVFRRSPRLQHGRQSHPGFFSPKRTA